MISLSDLLTPWEVIEKRLRLAAEADFVTVLYNPRSHGRPHYIKLARDIFLAYRCGQTPVGIVRNAARPGEEATITTLAAMLDYKIDMTSLVIIGNTQSRVQDGKFITPRGYKL
jgi:precorrin-3B C17-methyltransferase